MSRRKDMITSILQNAGDEYTSISDYIKLAEKTDIEVYKELEDIRDYYERGGNIDVVEQITIILSKA